MSLRVGARLRSQVCETEVVVVKAPTEAIVIRCGGAEMVAHDADGHHASGPVAGLDAGTLIGKRYVDTDMKVELLCVRAGIGSLSLGDELLSVKPAKPLPASD